MEEFRVTPGVEPRPQDWPEDFSHENGRYMCKCFQCGIVFHGHKRRVVCKLCVNDPERTQ